MRKESNFEETYIVLKGWMVSELNLKGNDLLTFALIFGFSQDGETEFKGSINFIAKWLNCSRPTAIKAADKLVEKGIINKRQEQINSVTFNRYSVNFPEIKAIRENFIGSKETLLGVVKKLDRGSKETLPNIYNSNIVGINNSLSIKENENSKNWEKEGPTRFKAAWDVITSHLKDNPAMWQEMANTARIKVTKAQFADELRDWLSYHQDNYYVTQDPVLKLTGGKHSFHSWLRQPWCVEKYNGSSKKGTGIYTKDKTATPAVYDGPSLSMKKM